MAIDQSSDKGFFQTNRDAVEDALNRAVKLALVEHKRAGNPVAVWRDGKVAWLDPDQIKIDRDQNGSTNGAA